MKKFGPVAPPAWFAALNPGRGAFYDWSIPTNLGRLEVTFYERWIACRFVETDRAKEVVDCNPFTGKWNFFGEDRERQMRHWLAIIERS